MQQRSAYGQHTLASEFFTCDEIWRQEQERIFKRYWICAGHQSRIPKAGEYFLLNIFNESLIVLRDKQNQIRALHKVCRHRGTGVCEEEQGRFGASIQCSYHAWTYGLDGKLIGAPFMKDVEGFRKEDYPLRAAPVHVWEGFIFVFSSKIFYS